MTKAAFPTLLVALLALTACGGNHKSDTTASASDADSLRDTTATEQVADSTIYGTSDEDFGMSTFSMITDNGDTLHLCRTAEDGTDAKIYGSLAYNQRYAITTRDNGEALGVLINLTELDRKVKDYEIRNGWLIVEGDTVSPDKYLKP